MAPCSSTFPIGRSDFDDLGKFVEDLQPFVRSLPAEMPRAIEIRNRAWLTAELADCLSETETGLALVDLPRRPRPKEWLEPGVVIPESAFQYVRLVGDRHSIERRTKIWDQAIVERK